MASVKIVLRKKQSKNGTYPLTIRITKDRSSSFIHTGYYVKESDWDAKEQRVRKSHTNSQRLNNFLLKKLSEANNKLLEMETEKKDVTSHSVKRTLKPQLNDKSFVAQSDLYLSLLKQAGKYNSYTADKSRIKHFKEFLTGGDISLVDINVSLLQRFQVHLKGKYDIGERTIVNHLVVIRSVFSQAIKGNVIDKRYYPFGRDGIKIKFPESHKVGLSAEEVKLIEELKLEDGSPANHARNLWLFSFYFAGIRASDVFRLRWSDLQNDRLYYIMGKNLKGGSLKVPEKALKILEQYKNQKRSNDDLIFPDLKSLDNLDDGFLTQKRIAHVIKKIDKHLRLKVAAPAEINKPLTMHIARHTFGNISGEKIPIQMLQKLYRHSSILTTIGYQANFTHQDADAALDAVIGF